MTTSIFLSDVVKSRQSATGAIRLPEWPSIGIREASRKYGYHAEYLRQLVASGKINGVKVGTTWLLEIASLERYIDEMRQTGDGRAGPRR